jgi:hypothetical protein
VVLAYGYEPYWHPQHWQGLAISRTVKPGQGGSRLVKVSQTCFFMDLGKVIRVNPAQSGQKIKKDAGVWMLDRDGSRGLSPHWSVEGLWYSVESLWLKPRDLEDTGRSPSPWPSPAGRGNAFGRRERIENRGFAGLKARLLQGRSLVES